jgi:hypothetical protein
MGHIGDVDAGGHLVSWNVLYVRYVVRDGNKLAQDWVQW